jgi:enoyl-CoA hydratase/carnithine racemase
MALTLLEFPQPEIAELVIDVPSRRNALSNAVRDEIADQLEDLAANTDLKVLIVAANGPVFSAGFDLAELARSVEDADFARVLWASSDRYHHAVASFPVVTIAAVTGPAIAGGFDLAVLCDLRVASTEAYFEHPEHAFGEVVYGPLWDLVGGGLARDLALTGRRLTAGEALSAGLVSRVAAPGDVRAEALDLARRVAIAPRDVLVKMKVKALARSGLHRPHETLEL